MKERTTLRRLARAGLAVFAVVTALALPLAACKDDDGPFEELGEEMDEAADEVEDAVEDATDDGG
jgi:hypothetical protein